MFSSESELSERKNERTFGFGGKILSQTATHTTPTGEIENPTDTDNIYRETERPTHTLTLTL